MIHEHTRIGAIRGHRTVTDNNQWHAPGGPPVPPQPQPFAPPVAPGYVPMAGYGAPTGQQPGWTPPPRPGLIPLRPLSFGTLLGASFQVMRRNPRPTFGMGLLLNGIVTLVLAVVVGGIAFFAVTRLQSASISDQDEIIAGAVGTGLLASLVPVALSLVVSAIIQGIVSLEVARATLGEKLTFGGLWRLAKGRIGALIGWSLMVTGVLLVVIVVLALLLGLIAALGGDVGVGVAVVLGILFGLAAVVLSAWISTKLSLVPSILMLERLTIIQSIRRSWSLTNGYFWKTLGTQLLVNVIVNAATQVISFPLSILSSLGTTLLNPNGDIGAGIAIVAIVSGASLIVSLVFGVIAAILIASVTALIYIDIRMRKEGLDLELSRFVEERHGGDTTGLNPYERLQNAYPTPSTAQYPAPSTAQYPAPTAQYPAPTAPPTSYGPPTATPVPPTDQSPWA